jgi:hypothetical protein
MLLPHLRPLWRGRTTLQLGTDPARAVVVEFADAATARLVELLDGGRTEEQLVTAAARRGVTPEATHTVVARLRRAGVVTCANTLLPRGLAEPARRRMLAEATALALADLAGTPAQALRRRAAARVLVSGHGALVAPIAGALATAGVGQVGSDPATNLDDVTAAVRRAAPEADVRPLRPTDATFVVLADLALALAGPPRRSQPNLTVAVRDTAVLVGPLVPGSGSSCVRCLDLHRSDRDRAWPQLSAQLAGGPNEPLCPVTTALAAAAYAANEVLAHLDGRPTHTEGAVVEIRQPGRAQRHSFPPHPRCAGHPAG